MRRGIVALAAFAVVLLAVYEVGRISARNTAKSVSQATLKLERIADRDLRKAQISACDRGNRIREENNKQSHVLEIQLQVTRKFLLTARQARLAAYERAGNKEDLAAAKQYLSQANLLSPLKFKQSALVDCEKTIAKVAN